MAGTRRTPIHRQPGSKVTPTAIKLFIEMQRIRCTCDPDDRFDQCPGCKKRLELDEQIGIEMKAPIWEYPCIERPGLKNPYPRAHANYEWFEKRPSGPRERWIALEQAVREMRRQERAAQRARKATAALTAPPEPPATP